MALSHEYTYRMGFKVNGVAIPDPSSFTGAGSDLDSLGKRDASGLLHRNMVAVKYHIKLEWKGLDWEMIQRIGSMLQVNNGSDTNASFQFTYPEPLLGTWQTITAYCGDREWECVRAGSNGMWFGDLKVSIIQF